MPQTSVREWMQSVSEVFDTDPRNGNNDSTVWLRRQALESDLEADLFTRGRHICIDGCSGSGKSSLVITTLVRHQIPFSMVQIGRRMDWVGFCRQLLAKPRRREREVRAGGSAEWKGIFPTAKIEFSVGEKTDEKQTIELWEKKVATATEHDIAHAIAAQNSIVLLDEFERAQPELANSVSEVCKILSQTFKSDMGRFVILGADDVYKKLYDAYSTLDSRLIHINIPTLPDPRDSWAYLAMGFRKLKKPFPGHSQSSTRDKGAALDAMQCVYGAANGLFKSLTELGQEICKSAGPNCREISLSTIRRVCADMEARNLAKYGPLIAKFHKLAGTNPAIAAVLLYINNHGLGQVHNRDIIVDALNRLGRGLVEDAILALWKNEFLVMTGASNEKLFVKNPSWAHTLRVYLSDPNKLKRLQTHLEGPLQFGLPLGIDWNSLETDGPRDEHSDG